MRLSRLARIVQTSDNSTATRSANPSREEIHAACPQGEQGVVAVFKRGRGWAQRAHAAAASAVEKQQVFDLPLAAVGVTECPRCGAVNQLEQLSYNLAPSCQADQCPF
jgi:hypothetical protein